MYPGLSTLGRTFDLSVTIHSSSMKVLLICLIAIAPVLGRKGFGPGEQEWGYVTVRPQAHMFWWLYYTSAKVQNYTERPLIIWLQGGPGASSTGYGNFAELGVLNVDLKERNHTWVKNANVLFVDNPVGTGWSYVDNKSALTTTNRQIADDFLVLLQGFYKTLPAFKTVPLYIMSESYGGKMAAEIGLVLDQAIKAKKIEANFKAVGLGDAWVSPIDSTLTWAPYLLHFGIVDQDGYNQIMASAKQCEAALKAGKFLESTREWRRTQYTVDKVSHGVDFYNVLDKVETNAAKTLGLFKPSTALDDEKIEKLMRGPVKQALNLNVTWGAQSDAVFDTLNVDFMKPVTAVVESLLNTTNIKVAVFTGQLDLIVDTPGTLIWVDNLRWTKSSQWPTTPRKVLSANNINEGYVKTLGNLSLYWINRAGHMVPADNPIGMDVLLRQLTNNYSGKVSRND